MAKKYYQTFKVKCDFEFPVDMLRYDSAFPATEVDSGIIARTLRQIRPGPTTVTIARFVETKSARPTVARWESFGCRISEIEIR